MGTDNGIYSLSCSSIGVEIESMRELLNTGSCKAFFRVRFKSEIGSIVIDNIRLVENKKGDYFVAVPSHKKGEKYFDDVEVTEDLAKLLRGACVKHYQEKVNKQ